MVEKVIEASQCLNANHPVLCHLKSSRTLKPSTTSGAKPSRKSIRIISIEELRKVGEEIFDEPDRPWRQTFLSVVTENPGATFYRASAGEGVIFLYSRDNDKGLWYLPGSGIGPLSEGGRQMMKEAIAAGPH